jgi:hypothetical protein
MRTSREWAVEWQKRCEAEKLLRGAARHLNNTSPREYSVTARTDVLTEHGDFWAVRIIESLANWVRHPRKREAALTAKAIIEWKGWYESEERRDGAKGELADIKPNDWRRGLRRDYRFGRRRRGYFKKIS